MRRLIDRCAGIDVGQALLVVCVRLVDENGRLDQQTRSFGATTPDLLDLRNWLAVAAVTHVAMESTGVYWKAPYYLLEDEFEVLLVNAAHLKHDPGRKTDVIDAQRIAEVLSYGLLRPSFVPPRPFRELRDLTRYRKALIRARTSEVNRLHKVLEDAGVKLATVATEVIGVSGPEMMRALIAGVADPDALAELAKARLRTKLPQLRRALTGLFRAHHAFLLAPMLAHVEALEADIAVLSQRIAELAEPWAGRAAPPAQRPAPAATTARPCRPRRVRLRRLPRGPGRPRCPPPTPPPTYPPGPPRHRWPSLRPGSTAPAPTRCAPRLPEPAACERDTPVGTEPLLVTTPSLILVDAAPAPHRSPSEGPSRPRRPGTGRRRARRTATPPARWSATPRRPNRVRVEGLGRAVREELVSRNVAQMTTLPAEQRARRTAWTAAQARAFLRAGVGDGTYPVFVLAVVHGLRRGEIAALQWDDVDFTTGRIFIRASLVRVGGRLVRGPVKTTAGVRVLPLVPLTRDALLAQRGKQGEQRATAGADWLDTGYAFTTRTGRPIEPRNLSRSFDRIVASAGLPRIVFHDLRRTAATLLKDLGVPARDAQVILGHANIAVTLGIYSEVFDTEIASALTRVNEALDHADEGDPAVEDRRHGP